MVLSARLLFALISSAYVSICNHLQAQTGYDCNASKARQASSMFKTASIQQVPGIPASIAL